MNNLIFWIIVCSWLIPLGIRMYNRSRARRIQNGNFRGPGYREQPYQQQNYRGPSYPAPNYPAPNYPGPGYPVQNHPGYPSGPAAISPSDSTPQPGPSSGPSSSSPFPPAGTSGPQGYRARKLAELDAKFSNGEIAMEDYMRQRGDIMNG